MSGSRPTRFAFVLGTLAILAIPAGVAASYFVGSIDVLPALVVATPVALVLGLAAAAASRKARYNLERTVRRVGERRVRFARLVAWAGVYVGVTGLLALGFYGVLRARS